MRSIRVALTAFVVVLSLQGRVYGQQGLALPPQCDPTILFYPTNLLFLGPVQFIQTGRCDTLSRDLGAGLINPSFL